MGTVVVTVEMAAAMVVVTAASFTFGWRAQAQPADTFQFRDGVCVNGAGANGYNPNELGPCGDFTYAPGSHRARFSFPQDLARRDLSGTRFKLNFFGHTNFIDSDLRATDFREVILNDADLRRARAADANFTGAVMRSANLAGADLSRTNFNGARLRGANLSTTNLTKASFLSADLTMANLSDANLRGTDLSRARTTATNFTGARFDKNTRLPFARELTGAFGLIEATESVP